MQSIRPDPSPEVSHGAGHQRRVLFKVRDLGQVNQGDEIRIACIDPLMIGRFRVIGQIQGATSGYVIAEPLPGTVIDRTATPRG